MELQAQIVKSGTWLYDGKVPHEVWIVRQNFDYYHDPGYQDEPCLSDDNRIFQVLYAHEGHGTTIVFSIYSMAGITSWNRSATVGYFAAATDVESSPVKLEPLFFDATLTPLKLFTYLKTPL